jgi:hypothetical protein
VGGERESDLLILANAYEGPLSVELARPTRHSQWNRFIDTSLTPPYEITEEGQYKRLPRQKSYVVGPRSVVVLVSG